MSEACAQCGCDPRPVKDYHGKVEVSFIVSGRTREDAAVMLEQRAAQVREALFPLNPQAVRAYTGMGSVELGLYPA